MNDNKIDQNASTNQDEEENQCGPGCSCGTTGSIPKWKMIICLVVLLAAAIVLTRSFARNTGNKVQQETESFSATAQVSAVTENGIDAAKNNEINASLWGKPLKGMESLNNITDNTNAVFLYIVKKGQKADETIKYNIEQAADKIKSDKMIVAFYILDENSEDYDRITNQIPAPCVLTMVKGVGVSAVTDDITEDKLIEAMVTASRPSSCGPSGCGSSPSGCN